MRALIATEHKNFFQKQGFIEFESLLKKETVDLLYSLAVKALEKETSKGKSPRCLAVHPVVLYHVGWLSQVASIAADLVDAQSVRFGYDQILTPGEAVKSMHAKNIGQLSSIQGILCGLMLCIKGAREGSCNERINQTYLDIFPSAPGNGTFFSAQSLLNFEVLACLPVSHLYVMIVLTQPRAVYVPNEADDQSYRFLSMGYAAGDRLRDTKNPVLYR